jgi:hypothetical protein
MTTAILLIVPTLIAAICGAVARGLIRRQASGWEADPVMPVVRSTVIEAEPEGDEIRIPKAA